MWCYTFDVNLFLPKHLPLIIGISEFMSHHNSICNLLYTCVECTLLQDFGRMNYMHGCLNLVLCRPLTMP